MKCDELKPLIFSISDLAYVDEIRVSKNFQNPHDHAVYKATEVEAAIAELKAENERLKRCEIWMKQHFYCEEVIACESAKNRKLKRAMYKACANWADVVAFEKTEGIGYDNRVSERWRKMESKCLKKAKEYK